ncbi:hypothetical protein ACOMHN_055449 [Nucella lapillus]
MKYLRSATLILLLLVVCIHRAIGEETAKYTQSEAEESDNTCYLPHNPGYCNGFLMRFYYNSTAHTCLPFIYGGCGGNDNKFETVESCLKTCFEEPHCLLSPERGPCKSTLARFYYNPETEKCEVFIYGGCDGNANRFDTEARCSAACIPSPEESCPASPVDECQLPSDRGRCKGFVPQFYYDKEKGKCRLFVYGGCGGNTNRFTSAWECNYVCVENGDPCTMPVVPGPCKDSVTKYFYNATSEKCEEFTYGGCEGNPNRFDTQQECEFTCVQEAANIKVFSVLQLQFGPQYLAVCGQFRLFNRGE